MTKMRYLTGIACLAISLLFSHSSRAELSIEELETQLDFTIRSACHGYLIDALPDFLGDARSWLNQKTPFCQTVRSLPDSESSADLLRQEKSRATGVGEAPNANTSDANSQPEFNSRMREYYAQQQNLDIECQDWMCQHVRLKVWREGNPISLADYQKVATHCDGGYGCIESWFASWPRELPSQTVRLSLDALLEAQSATEPSPESIPAPTTNSGLSLDALMNPEEPAPVQQQALEDKAAAAKGSSSAELNLDNIFSGREQLSLGKSRSKINEYNQRLSSLCECSLNNAGCFELPSESLLQKANQREQNRYQQCLEWDQLKDVVATSSMQASEQILALAEFNEQVEFIDNGMQTTIDNWHEERRRLIAQQRQQQEQRNDAAFLASIVSIVAQSGAVANGDITAEQAAQNAVDLSQEIQNGDTSKMTTPQSVTSSIPDFAGSGASSSAGGSSADGNFSCYDPGSQVCVDYQIYNGQKARQMKNQCRQGGNRLLSGCDRKGPSCSMSSPIGRQTTFAYGSSASRVKQACVASGGSFSTN